MKTFAGWALVGMFMAAGSAQAQDNWWVRVGPAAVSFSESATISIGGATVPGATVKAQNNTTLALELGYKLSPAWSMGLTIGVPPTSEVSGAGTAAPFGKLGKATYGPAVLSGQWSFVDTNTWKGYVGAGVSRLFVTDTEDGALQNLKVEDAWGSALQAGFEYKGGRQWGLFVDVKKIMLKTTATGTVGAAGGAAGVAEIKLNPLVTHAGVVWRF